MDIMILIQIVQKVLSMVNFKKCDTFIMMFIIVTGYNLVW